MGTWYHNFGTLELIQTGNKITGTFTDALTKKSSKLEASLDGTLLRGTYNNGQAFTWTLSSDLKTFNGITAEGQRWCGAKQGTAFGDGCSFTGTWTSASPGLGRTKQDNCEIKLVRTDNAVKGTYCNGELVGRFDYKNNQAVYSGQFKKADGSSGGNFYFVLLNIESQQFVGNASSLDGSRMFEWCGWRKGLNKPTPCLAKQ